MKMSFLGEYSCGNTTVPIYLSFSTAVCSTLISIVSTVGNSFVVLAVFLNPNKDLQSPFNYLIVNLSIADLAVGLITAPLWCSVSLLPRVLFHFLYCLDPKPVRPGARSVRRYYIFSVLQVKTQHKTKSISRHWCLDGIHSIIHELFAVSYNKFLFIVANTALVVTFVVLLFTSLKIFPVPARSS